MNDFDHRVVLIGHDASVVNAVARAAQLLGHPLKHLESVGAWLEEVAKPPLSSSSNSASLFAGVVLLEQPAGTERGLVELQQVCDLRHGLPVIVLSHQLTVADAVATMRAGAFTVLAHPCPPESLSEAIAAAIDLAQKRQPAIALATTAAHRWQTLNEGEQAVMQRLLDGNANKDIAHSLKIGLRTVELRRSRIMKKMQASSLAELVRMVCAAQSIS